MIGKILTVYINGVQMVQLSDDSVKPRRGASVIRSSNCFA